MSSVEWKSIGEHVSKEWDTTIVPMLCEYIKVPNQSPHYDPDWATNGLMMKAMNILVDWLKAQPVKGLKYDLFEEPGRTPFLFVEVDGTQPTSKTLFMYGHMDKQPPLLPWSEGLHPYVPVIRDGKLYGRAGADDGYAICSAITAIAALQQHQIPHGRIVITIEACEESGSFDLPHYVNKLKSRIGDVDLVICLDSGSLNYDQMWVTTSLRGVCGGVLTVTVAEVGVHSGIAGGVVPDSFRIMRHLLSRIEDAATGEFLIKEAFTEVPRSVQEHMKSLNDLGSKFTSMYPSLPGMSLEPGDNYELGVRNYWMPCLTITGADMPPTMKAGNVIRASTSVKLSIRVPPGVDAKNVTSIVGAVLERDPPYNCKVQFVPESAANGWRAPELKPWLLDSIQASSKQYFGMPFATVGLGGSIPFMGMLGELYPEAQFVVTGVLGPQSNAHGPDEFLHIEFGKGITSCVARVTADHFAHRIVS